MIDELLLSIIVPVYNVEKYIRKCIDSILSSTFKDFELILVNDNSQDNSLNICIEYSKNDNRIKIINNIENVGASLSRKFGLEISIGKYIQYIDSDDWIENNMLEMMIKKAEDENLDMVTCDYIYYQENKICRDYIIDKYEKIKDVVTTFGVCAVWNKLVRREILNKVMFSNTSFSEDRFITLQTIFYSNKFGHINIPLYNYVINTNIETKKRNKSKQVIDLYVNYILIIDFINKYNITGLEPELSRQINFVKLKVLINKHARKKCDLSKLYIESNFKLYLLKRIYKLLVPELFQIIINKAYSNCKKIIKNKLSIKKRKKL